MNRTAINIKNRLSLRQPQTDSLEILSEICDILELKKGSDLITALQQIQTKYPQVKDFEREFPSLCFALATGVGKTRLMGAFIAYLYIAKGIKNFFVLAPNITIYNKLITDFSNINHPKYVFKGIAEFVTNCPQIITGDNYNKASATRTLFNDPVQINIFNISKINAETRSGSIPRIKRLSEYIGESYFEYLVGLDDLVILMDESHHYRADRGMQVINELKPILGLELTATPQIESGSKSVPFKNVIYQYSLGKAIKDGFVKDPAVATRKNFNSANLKDDELDRLKLDDGIRLHEDTKASLEIYARNENVNIVKPFVLVVAQETTHASKLKESIQSTAFFNGRYADKVMDIHSNQRGEEKDENIEKLLSLEDPKNKIEIVIHVNMLKEGWDVTNLYTIIPLRASASQTLTEQTIGRGLRLPYGKITGNIDVDRLTIVAHDKYQAIIEEANKPDSIIRAENIIELDESDYDGEKEVITSSSVWETKIIEEYKKIDEISNETKKQETGRMIEVKKQIITVLPEFNRYSLTEIVSSNEIKEQIIKRTEESLLVNGQQNLFKDQIIAEIKEYFDETINELKENIIEIPRIMIMPKGEIIFEIEDFNLEVSGLNFQPVSEELIVKQLHSNVQYSIIAKSAYSKDNLEDIIVNELINYREICYDDHGEFLYKIANQAINKLKTYLSEKDYSNVVRYYKKELADFIYSQMKSYFRIAETEYDAPSIKPFIEILNHNFSKLVKEDYYNFRDTIANLSDIKKKIFIGFKKNYHSLSKFDSKSEKDFSIILEDDTSVLKWLRPAPKQFYIYWGREQQMYEPDFVVETKDCKYIVEIKRNTDIETKEVQDKARATAKYCNFATEYAHELKSKPWKYLLIPHDAVVLNMGLDSFAKRFEFKEV